MHWITLTPVAAAVVYMSSAIMGAPAQETTLLEPDELMIRFDEAQGTDLTEFLVMVQQHTGKVVSFDPRETKGVKLHVLGSKRVKRDRIEQYFETTLRAHGFQVVDLGGFLRVTRLGAASPTAKAPFVPCDQLDTLGEPSRVVTTVIAMKHVVAQEATNALVSMERDQSTLIVRAVDSANALVIVARVERIRRSVQVLDALEQAAEAWASGSRK